MQLEYHSLPSLFTPKCRCVISYVTSGIFCMQGFNRSFSSKLSIMYTSAQKTREPSFKPWAKTAKTACFSRETKCILLPLDLLFLVCFSNVSSPWNGAGEMPEKKKKAFYISSNCKDHGSAAWYSVQPVIPLKSTQSVWLDTVLRQKHILKGQTQKNVHITLFV